VFAVAGSPGASSTAPTSGASARAFAVKVVVPGAPPAATGSVSAPGDEVTFGGAFAYPADGSVVSTGSLTGSATTTTGDASATANASAEVNAVTLFGGEILAARVVAKARATARSGEAAGELAGSQIEGLIVHGQPLQPQAGDRIDLGEWGYAIVLGQGSAPAKHGYRNFVTALGVHLSADHGGLPAGSTISLGYAEAAATAAPPPPAPAGPPRTVPAPAPAPRAGPAARPAPRPRPGARRAPPRVPRRVAPEVNAQLTKGGYVFPVHGPASFTNTFGAPRAVVDWHHGEDIFAPMGAPVLAVAKGTVFSVGWNDLGGNRLWLRDTYGNEFYYAHLSAFSPLAVDGNQVEAGDVLGFVGNSGDAERTPPHLHFEIHPAGMLSLGYDGVVDPNPYLLAWRRLEDIRLVSGAAWTPPVAPPSRAPQPGAFLLSSSDISTASGLQPGSLQAALAEPVSAEAPPSEQP
jgi:murein DD-endopeptidase MepM/ murein hydrolase activator NlpD